MASPAKLEVLKRIKAKKDFKSFVLLKWERYEKKPFMDNWHYDYLCKILEHTLPNNNLDLANLGVSGTTANADFTQRNNSSLSQGGTRGLEFAYNGFDFVSTRSRSPYPPLTPQTPYNALQGLRFTRFDLTQNHSMILQNSTITKETAQKGEDIQTKDSKIFDEKGAFSSEPTRSLLSVSAAVGERRIAPLSQKAESLPKQELITRLMLNMPPSYGNYSKVLYRVGFRQLPAKKVHLHFL